MNYHKFLFLLMAGLLLLMATITVAHAACTQTIVYTPDGRQVTCQICTDMNGQATTVCY